VERSGLLGRWEVKVIVDGEEAGTFHFQLAPGAGQ